MIATVRSRVVGLSFRRRVALLSGLAVAIAITGAAATTYLVARDQLLDQIDDSLQERGRAAQAAIQRATVPGADSRQGDRQAQRPPDRGMLPGGPGFSPPPSDLGANPGGLGGPSFAIQIIDTAGEVQGAPESETFLPSRRAVDVARGELSELLVSETIEGESVRVLTLPAGTDLALQVARPLGETNQTLSDLLKLLGLITIGGVTLAAGLGTTVARGALAPLRQLSEAAEGVAETQDLTRRIDLQGESDDELHRLADSFNRMLAALEGSVGAQRQLVADASHELRTPLTSLRTNIETLGRSENIVPLEREQIQADLVSELAEMTALVGDVVELARDGSATPLQFTEVRLDEVVAAAVERARRRGRTLEITARLDPTLIDGDAERLDRAISNLIDNAIKWSPDGGLIEVTIDGPSLRVRDHGPGIAEADLPRIFDRFYRSDAARGMSGSGLGLAIVRQVADQHGASVVAANAESGGAVIEIRFGSVEQPEL